MPRWSIIFLAGCLLASPAFALDLPEVELYYEKRSGKIIGIVNKAAAKAGGRLRVQTKAATADQSDSLAVESADRFLEEKGALLGISNVAADLFPKVVKEDRLGINTLRYAQHYKGVPVYGAELVAQLNSQNEVLTVSGRTLEGIDLNAKPRINAKRALRIAKRDMERRHGWRKDVAVEKRKARRSCRLKSKRRGSVDTTLCVKRSLRKHERAFGFYSNKEPALYVYNKNFIAGGNGSESYLAWNVSILNDVGKSEEFFIEGTTGAVIEHREASHHETYRKVYDCSNFLGDGLCWSNKFSEAYNYTFGRIEGMPERGPNPVPGPLFGSTDVDYAYDLIPLMHNYYLDKFGRDGGNGRGGIGDGACPGCSGTPWEHTRILTNLDGVNSSFCESGGAFFQFNPPSLNFCKASISFDAFAHEYSHTIARYNSFNPDGQYNSVLLSVGESGTLNESNADLMGEVFEMDTLGVADWMHPTGSITPPTRNLAEPQLINYSHQEATRSYPDTYNSADFYCGSADSGGVHINLSVPSKAAYLASEGGEFNGCTIQGIGLEKIEQIWYRALTTYYTATTTFNQAYFGLNQACQDFVQNPEAFSSFVPPFQISQDDCDQVKAALQAVEMDQAGFCSGLPPEIPECAVQAPELPGDCDGNGLVDDNDYLAWKSSFNAVGPDLPCDFNADGVVDAADYTIWRDNKG